MATTSTTTTTTSNLTVYGGQSLLRAALIGLGVGALGWLLTLLFENFIIEPVFCRTEDTAAICSNGVAVSWIAAHLVVAIGSVMALIRAGVFRPLLVVLAAFISLWGLGAWLAPVAWYWGLVWEMALFALAYGLFAWLASVERFVVSILSTIVLVVVIRLLGAL